MSPPLLATKLFIPATRPDLVPRPRLMAKLNQTLQAPLTIISAPAGFGKTTLVSSWHRVGTGKDHPLTWLSLDSNDNQREVFFTYLLAALKALHPDIVRSSAEIMQTRQLPPSEVILAALINDISSFPQNFFLVLEDYQFITDENVHKAMAFLVENMPPPMRLIILTRVDPPLPLPRLRARNQLVEIRAADLRFELNEALQFLREIMRLELSDQEVNALLHRTEGWITGLQLAALSLQTHDQSTLSEFITKFSGSNRYILDFLSDEVLEHQPEEVHSFLLQTSILDRLSAPLCNAVTGRADSQIYLERLEKANLFVTALDANRQWYRYHHLFADLLRNHLRQTSPETLPALHRRASAWFQAVGQHAEAIQHSNAIQDYDMTTAIIDQAARQLKMFSGWGQILYWIKRLPEAEIDQRPNLARLKAWGLVLTDQVDGVESLLTGLEHSLQSGQIEKSAIQSWRGQIQTLRARLAYLKGDFPAAIIYSQQASDLLSENEMITRFFLLITLGLSHVSEGELTTASQALEEARRCSVALSNPVAELEAIGILAEVQELQGRLHQAVETYRRILELAGERIDLSVLSAHYHLGIVLYEWYQLEEAQNHLETCLSLAQVIQHPEAGLMTSLWLARIALARGEYQRAEELIHAIELEAHQVTGTINAPYIDGFLSMLRLSLGTAATQAVNHPEELSLPEEILASSFLYQKLDYLNQIRLLTSLNRYTEAETLAERVLRVAESIGDTSVIIQLLALKALILQGQGYTTQAIVTLTQALQRGQPEDYTASFVELGARMAELLRLATSQSIMPDYVARLLSLISEQDTLPQMSPRMVEPLSQRELEILRLVATGSSNQEIADQLVLAVGTVKKHLSNIYGKLGVQSRTQCILRAQELDLL